MEKLTETASTKSSTISNKAGSLKQAARKDNHLMPEDEDKDEEEEREEGGDVDVELKLEDDHVNKLEVLSTSDHRQMLEQTTAVHKTITKVCSPYEAEDVCFFITN